MAATTAHALPDAGEETGVDTMYTPVAKKPPEDGPVTWSYVSGAKYDESQEDYAKRREDKGLPTPYEVDFHGVGFKNPERGFAGGSKEQDGKRVPALYSYDELEQGWEEDQTFQASGEGYVSEITWLSEDRALAVGGDGTYPRREAPDTFCTEDEELPYDDPTGAGLARVWLYDSGKWTELERGSDFPEEMGALTALDAYDPEVHLFDGPRFEFAAVGGLCQIWHWSDEADREGPNAKAGFLRNEDRSGEFAEPYSRATTDPDKLNTPEALSYRVRSVAFAQTFFTPEPRGAKFGPQSPDDKGLDGKSAKDVARLEIRASTAGCCEASEPGERPQAATTLAYSVAPSGDTARGGWSAASPGAGNPELVPDSAFAVTASQEVVDPPGGRSGRLEALNYQGVVLTPGGPATQVPGAEPVSRIRRAVDDMNTDFAPSLSSLRLLDGDGDLGGVFGYSKFGDAPDSGSDLPPIATSPYANGPDDTFFAAPATLLDRPVASGEPTGKPDGIPDWGVGSLTGAGKGAIVGTDPAQIPPDDAAVESPGLYEDRSDSCPTSVLSPEYYSCNVVEPPISWVAGPVAKQEYEPTNSDRAQGAVPSWRLLTLDTHALNAVEVLDSDGIGYAVGDQGAIVKMTVDRSSVDGATEPEPPRLGSGKTAPPDASPYDEFRRPSSGKPDEIPPLGAALEELSEPRLAPYGSPNPSGPRSHADVAEIVMSRDGSEGWAVGDHHGGSNAETSVFRFDGQSWRRCDIQGIEGVVEPDPACEALAPLANDRVRLIAAARVPFENDPDPTNDDRFEVVAIPESLSAADPTIARYSEGAWRLEQAKGDLEVSAGAASIAFTAPDEGWFATANAAFRREPLRRFDGTKWSSCDSDPACGPGSRLAGARISDVVSVGERVYVAGRRVIEQNVVFRVSSSFPLILYKDRDQAGWHGAADGSDGGYDPAFGHTEPDQEPPPSDEGGLVDSLAISRGHGEGFAGWALGRFGTPETGSNIASTGRSEPAARLMRLDGTKDWQRFSGSSALRGSVPDLVATSAGGQDGAVVAGGRGHGLKDLYGFDADRRAFEVLASDRPAFRGNRVSGQVLALAPDNSGGVWAAVKAAAPGAGVYFYRYTSRPPRPVLREVPAPFPSQRRSINGLAGDRNGTVWAATDSAKLYRYDRLTGWDEVTIPGWDAGRVITVSSPVNALALGPDGSGLAVGRGGRIARIGAPSVELDRAAGVSCAKKPPPCGSPRELLAVDIASNGAAIIGGKDRTLLWRPGGGDLRAVEPPRVAKGTDFTAVAIADDGRAWVATEGGEVYVGETAAGGSWSLENAASDGRLISRGPVEGSEIAPLPIRAMDLDGSGSGYAVGDSGLVMERTGEKSQPWQRIETGRLDDLTTVSLPAGGGPGGLIGGRGGVVLTRTSTGFAMAEAPHFPPEFSVDLSVRGALLVPGPGSGKTEAWVAVRRHRGGGALGPSQLLHYTSDPSDPALDPSRGSQPLADAPARREGEFSLAAIGKSDCRLPASEQCPVLAGSTELSEVLKRRVRDSLLDAHERHGGPRLTLFTGDISDSASAPAASEVGDQVGPSVDLVSGVTGLPLETGKLHSWRAEIADPLTGGGLPLLGAVGTQDLSEVRACQLATGGCTSTKEHAEAGDNLAWREAMADQIAPWGSGDEVESGELQLQPAEDSNLSVRHSDIEADAEAADVSASKKLNTGGASTHYAVDVIESSREENQEIARIVFADNSLRSLAASDPIQQPAEPDGQLQWLEKVLCIKGQTNAATQRCTRQPHQQAIVVANTPTYSYGPGSGTDTATDATLFEATLMRHRVNLVVSGRLGWNGLYYALAPGLHEPCPGGEYPEKPPKAGQSLCGQDIPTGTSVPSPEEVAGAATELAADTSGIDTTKPLPFVVASSAGGNLANESDTAEASDGYWQGYTIIRLDPSGDPRKMIVEQRPVYDWVAIEARDRVVNPRVKMPLGGYARSPIGTEHVRYVARFDRIHSAAVTHRYDLLLADPEKPWVPVNASDATPAQLSAAADYPDPLAGPGHEEKANPCDPYVCLDPEVAKVDDQSGMVTAGGGNHPGTFAIATLSVGDHVATYPLYFESSPSFRAQPPVAPRPDFGGAAIAAPGTPSIPSVPQIPNVSTPQVAPPPTLLPPPPAPPASPPQPPVPPPVPPADAGPSPLSLSFAPTGLVVAPTASVIPPPAPPINPAPPGGARREARQRQAATQKSGADSQSGQESQDQVDMGDTPMGAHGSEMTRRDAARQENAATARARVRLEPSITSLAPREQPSAWTRGALYGGGIGFTALVAALAFATLRPTPRRRQPRVPAEALARAGSRHWPR